jgi:hypothetical protein
MTMPAGECCSELCAVDTEEGVYALSNLPRDSELFSGLVCTSQFTYSWHSTFNPLAFNCYLSDRWEIDTACYGY